MNKVEIKSAAKHYLRFPLYMLIPLGVIVTILCVFNPLFILGALIPYGAYAVLAFILYRTLYGRSIHMMADISQALESSQMASMEDLRVPYVTIDSNRNILWANKAFRDLIGMTEENKESMGRFTDFMNLSHDTLKGLQDDASIRTEYKGRIYDVSITRVKGIEGEAPESFYSVMLFDETELLDLKQQLDESILVVANVYVDNYDEIIAKMDDAKYTLLFAVVERKIRKYFGEVDAIIRKTERDKYLCVFPKKYLPKLIEDKFSILEDVKSTKVGNDLEVTLSIGIGLNGDSYTKSAEYSRTSTSLALGRGGSQVVVKDGGDVSIYGEKGKAIEKNTRVKARVKGLALKELIANRDRVIVMGHKISDFDCLGAEIGVAVAARDLGKSCKIVLNTVTRSLRPVMETFAGTEDFGEELFITSEQALEIADSHTLVVVVDTNRPSNTECPELLKGGFDVVVIDHHRQGVEVIESPILSYIEPYASSTCEMVAEILQYYSESIHITAKEADAIYAGILIDTNNFMSKTGVRTFEAAAYLKRMGAEVTRVRKLLREDINAYRTRAEIVRNAEIYRDIFAISICDSSDLESPTVVGAQAANELLNIVGIKASFVLTKFDGKIFISSRSIDEIDVQRIMEALGGGGHLNIAGAQIEDTSIGEAMAKLKGLLDRIEREGITA